MKVTVFGKGRMGGGLGDLWERAGHQVTRLGHDGGDVSDADVVLIGLGSLIGTARIVVDKLRGQGLKVGLVKLRFYRPFPVEYFKDLSRKVKAVGVIDRDLSFGYEGAVASDVKAALNSEGFPPKVINFIAGIAGRDIMSYQVQTYDSRWNEIRAEDGTLLYWANKRDCKIYRIEGGYAGGPIQLFLGREVSDQFSKKERTALCRGQARLNG